MKKFLVITHHHCSIEIKAIKDTYEEAKDFMDQDVYNFITSDEDYKNIVVRKIRNDTMRMYGNAGFSDSHSAHACTGSDCGACAWAIKQIEV